MLTRRRRREVVYLKDFFAGCDAARHLPAPAPRRAAQQAGRASAGAAASQSWHGAIRHGHCHLGLQLCPALCPRLRQPGLCAAVVGNTFDEGSDGSPSWAAGSPSRKSQLYRQGETVTPSRRDYYLGCLLFIV